MDANAQRTGPFGLTLMLNECQIKNDLAKLVLKIYSGWTFGITTDVSGCKKWKYQFKCPTANR